jgi:serine/threonine-protein kinase
MPNRFELRTFSRDLNKIRTSLSPQLQPILEKIRLQVVDLSSGLKSSKAKLKQKDEVIAKLTEDLQAKTKECDKATSSIRAYKAEVAKLTSEYTKIKELYDSIKAQKRRPIATPTQLSAAFRESMEAMRREVATLEDSPVDYVVSRFDISLKTGIGTDDEGKVSFRLPKEDEIANPETLSTIQFSIKSVPKVRK